MAQKMSERPLDKKEVAVWGWWAAWNFPDQYFVSTGHVNLSFTSSTVKDVRELGAFCVPVFYGLSVFRIYFNA